MKTIYLAGGCFWGMQKFFDQFDGVLRTEVGYANGPTAAPSYEDVCRNSGHAETVRVDYDENKLALKDLLDYYFMVIDPVSVNRQGHDTGIQYRTGIYYTDEEQIPAIREIYAREQEKAGQPLAVEVEPLGNFYPAEEYHQKYLDKNPGGYCHIPEKYFNLNSDLIAYCGVDCSACPDYTGNKCPGCRQTDWQEGDICLPVECCRKKEIALCGECPSFPCDQMKDFYTESESHREAYERMRALRR